VFDNEHGDENKKLYPSALALFVTFADRLSSASLLTNQVGIPDAAFIRGGGMYISLGLLVLIILLVVLLR